MQRRHNLTHLILAGVVALGLTLLMICVDAQAQITFVSDRDGHSKEIYVMDTDGGNQRRLINNLQYDGSPSWSPNGKRITFMSNRDRNAEIYVMDANGGNQRNLTKHGGHDRAPAWYTPTLAVAPVPVTGSSRTGKKLTMWGWLKQVDR